MPTIVVSNTGPLITLEKLEGGYDFIRKIVSQILIPQKVAEELSFRFPSIHEYMKHFQINDLIQIREINQISDFQGISQLDEGEIEAIFLARELHAELLIEEMRARLIAHSSGLCISGIAGKIGSACIHGIINHHEAIEKLQNLLIIGRINQGVYSKILDIISSPH